MKSNKRTASKTAAIDDASPLSEAYDGVPTQEDVARRAYEAFESGGSLHGNDVEHWLAAETSLSAARNLWP